MTHSVKKAPRALVKALRAAPSRAAALTKAAPTAAKRAPSRAVALTRRLDRRANRHLERAWPPIARLARRADAAARRWSGRAGRRLRPAGVLLLRLLSRLERRLLRARDLAVRAATRGSAVLTPERAICLTILASAACLVAAQFVEYRAVEVGQPGYAGLPAAAPPTVGAEAAGRAHAYLLVPVALLAAGLAVAVLRGGRRRLGRAVFALGLLAVAVVLGVDLPAGLDAGAQEARFSGATAVLLDGFYAQLAAASGLVLGGFLLAWQPPARKARARRHRHRLRKPSLARAQGGRRRERTV